ncbi:MAG: DEAD/DEAH box helicase family protein [Bacilli bacterium]|nr:DEAD/DEAH box helicase family protein [Bacilli bacterium]MBN2695908.1 DEAD/DEAH box helicase family protein [Bacilli bacterium]
MDVDNRFFCRDCLATSDLLVLRKERDVKQRDHGINLFVSLSDSQKSGCDFMKTCVVNRIDGKVQAVCGAGKTEMTIPAIHQALRLGWRICFAIPRVQIVLEIAKRLQTYLPDTNIKAIYGEKKDDSGAHVIVSTINQLVNYFEEFDLMIIDEADAYPYVSSNLLKRLVKKAKKPRGIIISMSATITLGSEFSILIHKRHHGLELPIPKFIQTPNWNALLKNDKLPSSFLDQLRKWRSKTLPILVFVPTIKVGSKLYNLIQEAGFCCQNVSSDSPSLHAIVDAFRQRRYEVLVSTTVLERGVTFEDVQVAVIMTDHAIFDASTLIQICGRVGRFTDSPGGEIVFFSEFRTRFMKVAREYSRKMNIKGKAN